jgi:predicted nucleic acid-binding protein
MPRARAVLDSLTLLSLPTEVFERAAGLDPELLRSPDAVHLAAALELGDELEGLVTYHERLATSAGLHGVRVVSPR